MSRKVWEEPTLILGSHPWLGWEKAPPSTTQLKQLDKMPKGAKEKIPRKNNK